MDSSLNRSVIFFSFRSSIQHNIKNKKKTRRSLVEVRGVKLHAVFFLSGRPRGPRQSLPFLSCSVSRHRRLRPCERNASRGGCSSAPEEPQRGRRHICRGCRRRSEGAPPPLSPPGPRRTAQASREAAERGSVY